VTFVSYAQNFEDVMLWRALKHVDAGFYIDVGANDPNQDSVTKAFYDRGWRGINLEPVQQWFEKLESERHRDINLQLAVGDREGELKFYEISDTGLSTTDPSIAEQHSAEHGYNILERQVPVKPLSEICADYHMAPIHFLKIDVEGAEKKVLEGMDFSKIRPWIIIIESTHPNTHVEGHKEWDTILLESDYKYVYFDGLNQYYVAVEHQEIENSFKVPPNIFDQFVFSGEGTSSFHVQLRKIKAENENLICEYRSKTETLERSENALAEQQTYIQRLQRECEAAKTKSSALESELKSKTETLEHSENALAEQQTYNLRLLGEFEADKTKSCALEDELKSKIETLARTENTLAELQAHSQWLQNEWDAAKTKVEELSHTTHQWWAVADGFNHELQGDYRSKSWRITWPLRKLMHLLNWLFSSAVASFF